MSVVLVGIMTMNVHAEVADTTMIMILLVTIANRAIPLLR